MSSSLTLRMKAVAAESDDNCQDDQHRPQQKDHFKDPHIREPENKLSQENWIGVKIQPKTLLNLMTVGDGIK